MGSQVKKIFSQAIVIFLLAGIAVVFLMEGATERLLKKGVTAPSLRVQHLDGKTGSLAELKGRVVLINFWATWCVPCREELPGLVKLADELEPKGISLLAINKDDASDQRETAIRAFAQHQAPGLLKYAVYDEPSTATAYRVSALPTLYVIGKGGNIYAAAEGIVDESRVRAWVTGALAEP